MKIVIDVETDGPLIGTNSMVCFGAVILDRELNKTFYGQMRPVTEHFEERALKISGYSRKQHEAFPNPAMTMSQFSQWIKHHASDRKIHFFSDNNGFDFAWMNYYFLRYIGINPFGHSSRNIRDLFTGFMKDPRYRWQKHRNTPHTHHPVDDAKGNAEALLWLIDEGYPLKLS